MSGSHFERTLAWAKRNERWLSSAFFVFGFLDHLITFGAFSLHTEILIFEVYLGFAAFCTLLAHLTSGRSGGRLVRAVSVLAPLFAQLTIGGVLAGFVVFYGKSSVISVSWPFLALLALIFIGNEALRDYRELLVFQTVLFYFSLYALAIFALPAYVGTIGERVFLESTALSIGIFAVFLLVLGLLGWQRLRRTLLQIVLASALLTGAIVAAYVTDVIPPLPLTLTEGGVYHSIVHTGDTYALRGEEPQPWYDVFHEEVVHHQSGTPLYAYSAIFAPGSFTTSVVHEWQRYDEKAEKWVPQSVVAFSLTGGREDGYRGYSLKSDPAPGKWRVLVKTLDGQTIGRFDFEVVDTENEPELETENR